MYLLIVFSKEYSSSYFINECFFSFRGFPVILSVSLWKFVNLWKLCFRENWNIYSSSDTFKFVNNNLYFGENWNSSDRRISFPVVSQFYFPCLIYWLWKFVFSKKLEEFKYLLFCLSLIIKCFRNKNRNWGSTGSHRSLSFRGFRLIYFWVVEIWIVFETKFFISWFFASPPFPLSNYESKYIRSLPWSMILVSTSWFPVQIFIKRYSNVLSFNKFNSKRTFKK